MPDFLKEFLNRNGIGMGLAILGLVLFWTIGLIILPQLSMLDFSFRPNLPPPEVGGPKDVYTLENYKYLVFGPEGGSQDYNTVDLRVFFRTLVAAVCVTIFNLILCYPIAYYLGQSKGSHIRIFAIMLVIPYWINEILRAFALRIIFGETGVLNTLFVGTGVFDTPFDFIRNDIALYAGLGYAYILLMIFPMYNVIESLDKNQIEAARPLCASLS